MLIVSLAAPLSRLCKTTLHLACIGILSFPSAKVLQAAFLTEDQQLQNGLNTIVKDHAGDVGIAIKNLKTCLLYTSPSPRDATLSRMPSSA